MQGDEEPTPYIEEPDEKDDSIRNGLMCFLDGDRECGPDCMSYTTVPAESPNLNDQQKNCTVLVAAERLGRYSGGLLRFLKTEAQDAARAASTKTGQE